MGQAAERAAEIEVEALGAQGDGIARSPEGKLLHVPFAAPGDRLRLDAAGEPVEILPVSPWRQTPPCPQFGRCGGCSVQHVQDEEIALWKADLVERALGQRGIEAEILPTITVPAASRRRAAFSLLRTREEITLGFAARGSHEIVDAAGCRILAPDLMAALPRLRRIAEVGAARQTTVRMTATASRAGLDLSVEGGKPLDLKLRQELALAAEALDLARLVWDGEPVAARRPPVQDFGGTLVAPAPGGFLQAVAEGESALAAFVVEALKGVKRAADLFAGAGALTFPLARFANVEAFESEASAVEAGTLAMRRAQGLKSVSFTRRDLHRRPLIPHELKEFQGLILDPPRAGAQAQCEQIARSKVPRVAMVTCNPASFARDARILIDGGYRLEKIQPVDQFRWSAHVEAAALFRRS
ncbi:hypothetical protein [Neomegalonema sp.]|uniref:class I SAM-dependent RNA methyltransferase n=1 Tax=Neomegalonema sp. TaxID=2039713 RepID=UPI0026145E88|nr:hypothetical protein [Neomegalonema sp.]MDD2869042.1 hypothetical protein [Neomegalonema sp.]